MLVPSRHACSKQTAVKSVAHHAGMRAMCKAAVWQLLGLSVACCSGGFQAQKPQPAVAAGGAPPQAPLQRPQERSHRPAIQGSSHFPNWWRGGVWRKGMVG